VRGWQSQMREHSQRHKQTSGLGDAALHSAVIAKTKKKVSFMSTELQHILGGKKKKSTFVYRSF